ncbi:2-amino-4-hydroxy-6-hydroxymethyldihydropteridine diphosphokinase [Sphingobacterium hungaricum]|uniref:2-amino-4-hydroxy-6-hydroxymethyldihydropteridine pyrophosphokinase n=1 Tax=Sphingobacterium hungaricum TaxID=2082723 RepID=A0A928YTS5_9SPHI|nr:2-amino-4-hydroxy-6-hydroxymethyldihydropteridine diphosphokinase [Sphingobacterium hungaricum]MBE8715423.1 2-amino-4-hydroxy-6-hydroxymethyldihydropteridine diphosphokinase [Sphingobacterium hungaricum]
MEKIYLLIGSNLNNPEKQLALAEEEIKTSFGNLVDKSSIYETEAWGVSDQPVFLNQVLVVESNDNAADILAKTQEIELKLGRERKEKWGARIIDIDILYIGEQVISTEQLKIPHPYIQERNFALIPLIEIEAKFLHPVFKVTNEQLLQASNDTLEVKIHRNEKLHNSQS